MERTWTQIDCKGIVPEPRKSHSAAVVGGVMYIFGGENRKGEILGDFAAFQFASSRWYTIQDTGLSPGPRVGHSMCVDHDKVFLLGGISRKSETPRLDFLEIYSLDTSRITFPKDYITCWVEFLNRR